MDWLDIAHPSPQFTAHAKYYEQTIDDPSIGGQPFRYENVDPFSHTYRRLFGNIQSTDNEGETAIRTNDRLPFHRGSYVILPDGRAFQIIQMMKDVQKASKQALRFFPTPVATEYVIRMVQVENPWEVS